MERNVHPRVLLAAPRSGSGKTTITCAILAALKKQGLFLAACKCGPDYIDPMFHRQVLEVPSGNLDTFFTNPETTRELLAHRAEKTDLTIIEGVMGYFDGLGGTTLTGSTYEVAAATDTPVILIVDAKGASLSLAAQIRGFLEFPVPGSAGEERPDRTNGIRGILLNRVSAAFYPRLKTCLEEECGIPVLGYFPSMEDISLPSRHLGLVSPGELADAKAWVETIADQAEKTIDLSGITSIAKTAPALKLPAKSFFERLPVLKRKVRIAVARDAAFSFRYEENEDILTRMGAELIPFSPLADETLPDTVDGLILWGGYPELHIKELQEGPLRLEIAQRIRGGLPCIAECGGFLYLLESLTDKEGNRGEMAGVLKGSGFPTGGARRFGYFEAVTLCGGLYGDAGTKLKGHEFHYYDTENPGDGLLLRKPLRGQEEKGVVYTESLAAGFPHMYYASCPEAVFAFLSKCLRYQAGRLARERWNRIAHPLHGLGELEELTSCLESLKAGDDIDDRNKALAKKALVVFCGDHGVTSEGVAQSDSSVTGNVAKALSEGRSAANALAESAGADVYVVNAGMKGSLSASKEPLKPGAIANRAIAGGTKNFLLQAAMTREECEQALRLGEDVCAELKNAGYGILAAGEMGIGNTTSAAALTSLLLGLDAEETVGRGAGLGDDALAKKKSVVARSVERARSAHPEAFAHTESSICLPESERAKLALMELGGFEIAAMAGLYLGGAKCGIAVVADGVISLAAGLIAEAVDPRVKDILFVSHLPAEPSGAHLLRVLGKQPLLDGGFHLGEGSGAVLLFPLLDAAMAVYRSAPTFAERGLAAYKQFP